MPTSVRLADLTTLRLGGPAPELVTVTTADEVAGAMRAFAGQDVLVLGGGSNLVVADAGVPGPVVRIAVSGVRIAEDGDAALVTVGAGEDWDDVVAQLVDAGFTGLAPLSGIPGSSGATPVQNVGAYGTEISELLESVTLYDRLTGEVRSAPAAELELAYRSSILRGTARAIVLDITLALTRIPTTVAYAELARTLGVAPGATAPEHRIREAVLALRRSKGMVIEAGVDDPDTRSAGSFFTNPILDEAQLAAADAAIRAAHGPDTTYPRYPTADGRTKLSAAWLIERAGFAKGYDGPGGRVGVSTKHTLALVNRGAGSTADLLALAREIRDGVRERFKVRLHPEPVFVGVQLD
ncbi:UDP-N-acetylmuramate dehydrogenase [Nakamurella panacisegetis]|uniref:UDP-N-acetylmuramate dehydrogenase n=1 Tax=Nakamurella panacisegetis TaxID=1090615 RepID=UPI000A9CED37|nr:UDP-N-acetylmuramate dehydrogenase [Nakamurella panacisegetis]